MTLPATSAHTAQEPALPGLDVETIDDVQLAAGTCDYRRHTAAYVQKHNPRLVSLAMMAIGFGVPYKEVAEAARMSEATIVVLAREHAGDVEVWKERLSRKFLQGADLAVEEAIRRLVSNPEKFGPKDLSILAGIFTEKGMLTAGQATSRVAHVSDQEDPFDRAIREAREQGKVIDVTPDDMGIGREPAGQMGAGGASAGPANPEATTVPGDAPSASQADGASVGTKRKALLLPIVQSCGVPAGAVDRAADVHGVCADPQQAAGVEDQGRGGSSSRPAN